MDLFEIEMSPESSTFTTTPEISATAATTLDKAIVEDISTWFYLPIIFSYYGNTLYWWSNCADDYSNQAEGEKMILLRSIWKNCRALSGVE